MSVAGPLDIVIDGVSGVWTPSGVKPDLPDGYLSPHFLKAEFDCNHCGKFGEETSLELLEVLEDVRRHFEQPITVNSGVRCLVHNSNVGGATNSRHRTKYADAADIVVKNVSPGEVHSYLSGLYPDRYGLGSYNTFTHIDVRPNGPARWTG